ncbi:hypothetical protein J113_16015 [Mycobacterium tuberculosis CAS/NITR204]|uniref:Uncharacterized protein n=1 Tax=Mycobacterium tuberculosis CAS/NITR204 TaxID=1310114 RepID=R4MA86_MYCTX|nr:hypothetical protein J113_16015 [Mycobacterium tuberculosis CAS/NITR204]KAF3401474.1 hypothetical protein BIT18_1136 [Mycobacterium tuberculosis variant bovis]KAF3411271.1 hypothetical protein BIT17_4456 [Mycobacterium tuberculosis variant bovis]BAW13336.1 hypothetical protein NCGM946K2_2557 [Mycobacterium tuberculosis]
MDYRNHRSKQKIDTKFNDAAGRRWPRDTHNQQPPQSSRQPAQYTAVARTRA